MSLLTSNILSSLLSKIKAQLDAKAPTSHASSSTTYGRGTNSVYGHLRLTNTITNSYGTGTGYAATPYAVYTVNSKVTTNTNNITTLTSTVANKADAEDLYDYVPLVGWASSSSSATSSSPYIYGYPGIQYLAEDAYLSSTMTVLNGGSASTSDSEWGSYD